MPKDHWKAERDRQMVKRGEHIGRRKGPKKRARRQRKNQKSPTPNQRAVLERHGLPLPQRWAAAVRAVRDGYSLHTLEEHRDDLQEWRAQDHQGRCEHPQELP